MCPACHSDAEEEEDRGDEVYGSKWVKFVLRLIMAGGGSHAWDYVLDFKNEDDYLLYRESIKDGKELLRDKVLALVTDFHGSSGIQYVKVVVNDYVFSEDEDRFTCPEFEE
jgi:hypothetical protein